MAEHSAEKDARLVFLPETRTVHRTDCRYARGYRLPVPYWTPRSPHFCSDCEPDPADIAPPTKDALPLFSKTDPSGTDGCVAGAWDEVRDAYLDGHISAAAYEMLRAALHVLPRAEKGQANA